MNPSARNPTAASSIEELFDGPLAIVGDVHGELDALELLLGHLAELDDRKLVFLGDLVDRGPDSPGVVRRVRALVDAGRASALIGNHELNLLRQDVDPKGDNRWFRGETRHLPGGDELPERRVTSDTERSELLAMLADLPVALERPDLRLVHACWDDPAIEDLRAWPRAELLERHAAGLEAAEDQLRGADVLVRARAEERRLATEYPLVGRDPEPPPLSDLIAHRELTIQNGEPLRVVTSGREAPIEQAPDGSGSFAAGGKWRHTRREAWWHDYAAEPTVVIGHYWRGPTRPGEQRRTGPPDPFAGECSHGPIGAAKRVWCIDFSVGRRFLERIDGSHRSGGYRGRLAALRWPEGELVFDDGQRLRPPR